MVATDLTPDLVQAGESLLKELDSENAKVNSALWYYFPDDGNWKLLLSFGDAGKEGPRAAYARIQKALSKLGEGKGPALADIGITKPDAPLLELLKTAIRTGSGVSGVRFTNNVINGQLIRDAHIYRLT
jgi:hypothetical protein